MLGLVVGAFLVVRGVAEPFVIDVGNPESYQSGSGGPSVVGVLAVHTGPAVVVLAWVAVRLVRRHRFSAHRTPR